MTAFRLGPSGDLRPIPRLIQRGAQVASERVSNEMRTLDGTRRFQRSTRANRTWALDLGQWRSPEDLAYLTALADGSIPGRVYLYTESAAQTNLFPVSIASPGAMGVSGLRGVDPTREPPRGRVKAVLNGALTTMVAVSCDPDMDGAWSETTRLPLGEYCLSVWSSAAGDALKWRTVDMYGDAVSTGTLTTAATAGGFRSQSIITLAGAAEGLQVALPPNIDPFYRVGALRLTAGLSQTPEWLPGEGVPEVVVEDPQRTLQLLIPGRIASDYTVTIKETG